MKILAVGDPHGEMNKVKKIPINGIDLTLITGDLGRVDVARKNQGLKYDTNSMKLAYNEIYFSTLDVLRHFSKFSPVYSILGNTGMNMVYDSKVKNDEKEYGVSLPYLGKEMKKIKNFHLIRNTYRNFNGLRIGFLEYFIDTSWVQEFKPSNYKKRLIKAKKETDKAKTILKNFNNLDILVCHQPPYGYLDKVNFPGAPVFYQGKHAGSKVILDYTKKYQPKYVFCGHIHEGEGMAKIGKTEVYNLGIAGHKIINL